MQHLLLLFLLWTGGVFTNPPSVPSSQLQAVLTPILSAPSLAPFWGHYLRRQPIYFRFLPSKNWDAPALRSVKNLSLRVQHCPPLIYNTTLDERRYPVVTVQVLELTPDSARIRIGLPIEGVTGQFTLLKAGTWVIRTEDVAEI